MSRQRLENTSYFQREEESPDPLVVVVRRRIRFEEIDPLGIVWHGRYVSYFEDGRVAFGRRFGLSYREFMVRRVAAPIVRLHIDYLAPLVFDESIRIETALHWSTALRLNFQFTVRKRDETIAATGYSVQLLTDLQGSVLLLPPEWVQSFRDKWQGGLLAGEGAEDDFDFEPD